MESNFYIASRLSKVRLSEEEKSRIGTHFSVLANRLDLQEEFFSYCRKWKLAPWIHTQIERNSLHSFVDKSVLQKFDEFHTRVKTENEARNTEALRFLNEFKREKIDVALLKGNMFLHSIYGDVGYKKMNDFDMLIRAGDWPKVQEIYFHLGYIPLGFGWGGEKGKAAKFSHAGLSFISPDFACITGTQWGLKSPTSSYKVNIDNIWKSVKDFDFNGLKIHRLSTEYNLLHLILHMGLYKCGIRDCMDVYNLLLSSKDFDEDQFVTICRQSGATDKAVFTLRLTNECSDVINKTLLEKLSSIKSPFIHKRLNSRLKLAAAEGDIQLSYNDYFHDVEMTVFYFSLFQYFHQKISLYLRLTKQLIFPSGEISNKLSDLGTHSSLRQRIIARIKAPYLIIRLIGEEIGIHITILLLIKLFIETFISIKNYFFRKENYFEYLRTRNINPSDIQQVVKNIQ